MGEASLADAVTRVESTASGVRGGRSEETQPLEAHDLLDLALRETKRLLRARSYGWCQTVLRETGRQGLISSAHVILPDGEQRVLAVSTHFDDRVARSLMLETIRELNSDLRALTDGVFEPQYENMCRPELMARFKP